jgi:hypothetical protein
LSISSYLAWSLLTIFGGYASCRVPHQAIFFSLLLFPHNNYTVRYEHASCLHDTKCCSQRRHRALISVSSGFISQYISPCPLSSFLFKIPVPCSHTLCDISLSQHAVHFPSPSPNIDYLKKQSKRLLRGALEVLALRLQTEFCSFLDCL